MEGCGGREGGRDGDGNVWFDTLLWIIYAWAEFGREVNTMELSFAWLCFVLNLSFGEEQADQCSLVIESEACIHIADYAQKIQFWIKSRFKAYSTLGHTSRRGVKEG